MERSVDEWWQLICAESRAYYERVKVPATRLADSLAPLPPDDHRVVDWLKERLWSEREGTKTKAYAVIKLAEVMDFDLVRDLAQQSMSEANHYTYLDPCLKARGGTLEGYEALPRWRRIFDKEYEAADTQDPIVLFATIHMGGEGPASATAEIYSRAYLGTPNEDIALAYQKIAHEESGHWSTGENALRRYLKTPEEGQRAMDALRAMGDVLFGEYSHRSQQS